MHHDDNGVVGHCEIWKLTSRRVVKAGCGIVHSGEEEKS